MEAVDADIVVIGMGPAGEHAANRLARAGLEVVGVEERLLGGECPYWACVPTKMMTRAAGLLADGRRIPGMAGQATVRPDWSHVAHRIREEATGGWDDTAAVERFVAAGGTFVRGRGRITAPGEVTVTLFDGPDGRGHGMGAGGTGEGAADGSGAAADAGGRRPEAAEAAGADVPGESRPGEGATTAERLYRARRGIVVAAGTHPAVPPIDGLAGTPFWTNRNAVESQRVPESLLVLGGGVVGTELAQVFARFGSRVTVVEAADHLLTAEEPEVGRMLAEVFAGEGIAVLVGASPTSVGYEEGVFTLTLDGEQVEARQLLVATGRFADLVGLGIGAVGLDERAGRIEVDEWMRAAPGVWAVGDVTGHGNFTHVAVYQAEIAVRDILGEPGPPADYRAVPRVTFTDPEIGSVGLTVTQARQRGVDVRTGVAWVPETARGWIHKSGNDGLIKLVADAERGVLVGATSVGPHGGEVLGALTVAVHAQVPVDDLRHMIYAYPTFHRGIEDALRDLRS